MIGNDIVDLALAKKESNWQRKGYLDKIFTQNEQFLILNSENPAIMVWNLWSRKEAAYKIHNRKTKIRGYFPLQLECNDLDISKGIIFGTVVMKDFVYFTKTIHTSQFTNTIAVENVQDFDKIITLENRKNIQKNNGIPYFYEQVNCVPRPVSISHHGRFEQILAI
ncbi:MAG: 4-phosphopantetheinyl transferase family protein [Flavobacterium sp.]|nr:4-phosphopantetheinyl transferase family protein [Flavobacterium sp.]